MGVLKRDGGNGVIAYPKKIVTCLANGTIAVGQVVKIETDNTATPDPDTYGYTFVVTATAESNSPLACGVAVTAAADAEEVQIQVAGFNSDCTAAEAIAIGATVSGSASGQLRDCDALDDETVFPFGVCVNAITSGQSDGAILIMDKGWFY
tara:strand:- start:363 stop:815 length:453 start_codon:yes stop_codon:yes gene_type:complete